MPSANAHFHTRMLLIPKEMFIQAVESGVPPCVDIPTYEEYKTQSKELLSVCYCAKPSCFGILGE